MRPTYHIQICKFWHLIKLKHRRLFQFLRCFTCWHLWQLLPQKWLCPILRSFSIFGYKSLFLVKNSLCFEFIRNSFSMLLLSDFLLSFQEASFTISCHSLVASSGYLIFRLHLRILEWVGLRSLCWLLVLWLGVKLIHKAAFIHVTFFFEIDLWSLVIIGFIGKSERTLRQGTRWYETVLTCGFSQLSFSLKILPFFLDQFLQGHHLALEILVLSSHSFVLCGQRCLLLWRT